MTNSDLDAKLAPVTSLSGISVDGALPAAPKVRPATTASRLERRRAVPSASRVTSALALLAAFYVVVATDSADVESSARAPRERIAVGIGTRHHENAGANHVETSEGARAVSVGNAPLALPPLERRPRGRIVDLSWASKMPPPPSAASASQLLNFRRDAELAQLGRHVRGACRNAAALQTATGRSVRATAQVEIAASGAVRVTRITGNAPSVSECVAHAASAFSLPPGRGETREMPFSWIAQ